MKPTLDLYIGKKVVAVEEREDGEAWEWAIVLENGVKIFNKSRDEVFPPTNIVGLMLGTISMSGADTTIHFRGGMIDEKVSFKPTQYAILDPKYGGLVLDPKYGGLVYPQWPEELEEAGIPSHPDEEVSAEPSAEWPKERAKLVDEMGKRHQRESVEFLSEDK